MYGNLDKDKICEFPEKAKNNYVVRHSRMFAAPSGSPVEDPSSVEVAIYSSKDYEKLFETEFGKTGVSVFQKMKGMTVQVLHDPTQKGSKSKPSKKEMNPEAKEHQTQENPESTKDDGSDEVPGTAPKEPSKTKD